MGQHIIQFLFFSDIANTVLRRDLFSIIFHESLLPTRTETPANYECLGTLELNRDCEPEDICDFIVEYINSDVLVRCFPPIHSNTVTLRD